MINHCTPSQLLATLDDLGVVYQLHHHPPLHTVEDAIRERGDLGGSYVKNLYLKDRQGRMALIVCLSTRSVNLQRLRLAIGFKRLSFASSESLWADLGVQPGSVSPLALINASPSRLSFFADEMLRDNPLTNFHPLTNEMTVQLKFTDWVQLCTHWGFSPSWLNFDHLPEETR